MKIFEWINGKLKYVNPNFYLEQYFLKWFFRILQKAPNGVITLLGILIVALDQYMKVCEGEYCTYGKLILEGAKGIPLIPDFTDAGLAVIFSGLLKKSNRMPAIGDPIKVNGLPPAKK